MSWIFGKKKTPAEMLRENKRMLDKAIRDLDRERMGLQNQEKKLVAEIKKTAKQGQMDAVKVMAKSLVRNRHAVTKMYGLKSQLQAVSLRIATLKSTQAMADAMRGATKAMGAMNKQMNLPALTKIMREFERQNEKMEMTSEMMGDAVDDAFEGDGEEEETDNLVNEVLDEIGINLGEQMVAAPGQKAQVANTQAAEQHAEPMGAGVGAGAGSGHGPGAGGGSGHPPPGGPAGGGGGGGGAPVAGDGIDQDLQARLDNLRKS
ncbi:g10568 [Coccomyxa viridis]|uniref:G10568 protein n=1 Tax=Coccomyxa viridis TaxID=1274662 RepID=A0ABP1GBP0_9CHLO